MTYPNPGVLKAAMGHYLTESARTALEAMEPEEDVIELGPGKQMPVVGPNQILDMPLFTKIPFLPGSNTMFYRTNLGEKLYQPSATFDLSDPYCKIMAPKYKSLHDPHLRAYYKRKDNLRRLKKSGLITDKNKVVCTLKEFNEYRQYLTSRKLEFEKHYLREQKMLEKQVTKLQDTHVLPEAAETSKYRDWLLKEERPTIQEQETVMRNRYLELINQELEKLEELAEENRSLSLAQDDKKKQGAEKRKQLLLRKKMEEEWKKKEMSLLIKIGDDVKREARIEEQQRKSKEDKLKRKQVMLEKKMAHHLMKLQARFQREGLLPSSKIFPTSTLEDQSSSDKKDESPSKKSIEDISDAMELENASTSLPDKETQFSKGDVTMPGSQISLSKERSDAKSIHLPSSELIPRKFASIAEQETLVEKDLHQKGSRDLEPGESAVPQPGSSKVSFSSTKDVVSMTSSAVSNNPSVNPGSGMAGMSKDKFPTSASAACASNDGGASVCGSAGCGSKASCSGSAGCGSKTSCCGSAGCGSKTSCCGSAGCGSKISCSGSAGCGSKTSCCRSAGCGSKTSCCGSTGCGSKTCKSTRCGSKTCGLARCGSKTSCCGSTGCGSKTSCCGSTGCGSKTSCCGSVGCGSKTSCCGSGCGLGGYSSNSGKTGCCGSAGCGSSNGKAGGGYDSSGSSKHGTSNSNNKHIFSCSGGANPSHRTPSKPSGKASIYSAAPRHAANEGSCKVKQKKKAILMNEPESQPRERHSEKKRRLSKGKTEHVTTKFHDNEDCESSYSAYLQRLLSTSDQSALRESLKGKVSSSELNNIIQNIMTWVVSAVTSILYPALTKFEERVRTRVYTISEESVVSSENSSSCTSCNEDLCESYGGLPAFATRKVSFTNTSIKPTTSSPTEFRSTSGKPVSTSLLSSKSSFTSFTKSTHLSLDSDILKGKFKRGKTAVFFSPSKDNGLLSTTTSMKSSKSDSHLSQMQKSSTDDPENASTLYHSKKKHTMPKRLLCKTETTMTTDSEELPSTGGEQKPPNCSTRQRETIDVKDLKSIFSDLKLPLAKVTAVILDDIFKKMLGDLGSTACSVSISMEVLLESISDSLLGTHFAEPPVAGSVSRVASFVANDIVENVLSKLQSTAQKKYFETISRDDFSTEWKAMCLAATEKYTDPDPAFWRAQMPLSFESMLGIAEEIVQIIIDKLKVFALSSQKKVSQFELFSKIKSIGIPLEQLYAAIPPHTVESEAANAIVKDTIRKIVSKTVASSETNILQYVEEMIGNILSYIQQQVSQEGIIPSRESSIIIQIINDVFNDLSTEKLRILSPSARPSSCPKIQKESPSHKVSSAPAAALTMTTLFTTEKNIRKPFPPVNVPGMVIYSEAEQEDKEKRDQDGKLKINKEQKLAYEGFGLEPRQRSRSRPKSALQDDGEFLDKDMPVQSKYLEKTDSSLDTLVQNAIFSSMESQQTATLPTDPVSKTTQGTTAHEWTLEQALKQMEEDLKGEEQLPIIEIMRNLLKETFQHVCAEQTACLPQSRPSSLTQVNMSRQQAEEEPTSKGQSEITGQILISDTEVRAFVKDLVKTVFQILSRVAQTDMQDIRNRQSSLVFTDILPLSVPTEAGKSLPTVHFRDPEKSFDSKFPQEEVQNSRKPMHEPKHISQSEHLSKSDLANDLVQTFIAKLESFVLSRVESQLCLDVQNLKMSISSDFSSALQEEFKRILANQDGNLPNCLEDIFNSYNNSILAAKEKPEQEVSLSYSDLKSYASDVATLILKNIKHELDKEVDKISTPPIIFSESIAATQIVSMVLTIFAPQEHLSEAKASLTRKESVLEKVFKKNPIYKRDLQAQIQNTVETLLNEIFQTIMLDMDDSGTGELQFPKAADDSTKKSLSTPAGVKSVASLVSNDLVDIVFEDLSSGLAAALNMKGELSSRLQSLLYDFVQKTVEPLAQLKERGSKAGHKSRFPDLKRSKHQAPGVSKAEKTSSRKLAEFSAKQLPDIKDFSPEGIAKYLVDNVFLRLEMFVEDKLESELGMAAKQIRQSHLESGYALSSAQKTTGVKTGNHCDKAKLAVQDSQYNLRLCAEKLTCTIIKVIQKDLEREMLSCQNLLPFEENASANEIMNDLLKIITVQIALTENEIQKRVLKRIFKKQQPGQHGGFPLLASVEDVLSQVTQRIMGDLGLLPSFNNDSIFFNSEPKSSHYNGMMETASQANTCNVAGEIVNGILNKMYSAVVDTLFSSSASKLETNNSGSNKDSSDIQKITLAVSQLQPSPQSLSEELIQSVLNKIACFAASHLEEVLPLSVQQRWKGQSSFQCDMQADSNTINRSKAMSDDSESSVLRGTLSKSDLTVYAKDVVSKVLGTIIDEFKTEDYHRTIFQVNTLSSEQISKASELINSVVQDLHTDDLQFSHMHKHTSLKRSQVDGLPSTQMFFQFELTTKDIHGKPKGLFYEDFACYLNQILPKEGILREIFEQQPLTDANINETLKMLQVAENIVSEVYMRTRDLEPSVCILKKIPGEVNERLFYCSFKKVDSPRLFHSDSQAEIGSVARDIVASVFENVHRCLLCSVPASQDKYSFLGRKDQAGPNGCAKIPKHRFTQPEFPFYNVSLKSAMDTIDKIAKETVECIVITLETFVARHFKRDFKCNFLEIVKFPLESLSFAQLTRSLDSLSTHVGNVAETTVEALRNKLQGDTGKGTLPTLGSTHNFLDFTKLGGAITRECIESAIQQVQKFHSELNVYANNAVSSILEIIKHTLDRELIHKEVNLFSSSSESLVVSETISVMLDRCNESLTEITSELMVENLQLEMSGRAFAKDRALAQNQFKSPRMKTTSKTYRRIDTRDSFPPINVPGMVIYSEEENEVQEEVPAKFPSVFKYSEWDTHGAPEREKCRSRHPRRRRQDKDQIKLDCFEEDWLPRQSSIPEGSILEKLFKKTAEATPRQAGMGHPKKANPLPHHESFAGKYPFTGPESTCYSVFCPLKLGHTAETIVNTLLCEFGVEDEPMGQSSYSEKSRHLSPLKEKSHLRSSGSSRFVEPKQKRQSLLNRWEIRLSDSSDKTLTEESYLLLESGSLLSKWESKQHIFKCKSPERHKDLELLACAHVPDPCETLLLANHIVLSVIKELITFQSRDAFDEVSCRTSLPAWKQELIQSESKWLQDQIWRNTYLPSGRKQSSCHDVFWEPLTQAVLSNVLYSISSPSARHNIPERNECFERPFSMFCSVDACCPEHGLRSSKSPPMNMEELAFHISEVIINSLCERNILQESINKKGFHTRRSRRIFVPPLCLADFDNVYQPLVKEVNNVLSLEIELRSRYGNRERIGDSLSQQHLISSPRLSRASRGDCRGSSDVKRTSCLSTVDQIALKNRRLNNVASNLDSFICSLKTSESKNIVNKVLHIILDSLWPDQSQNDFGGSYSDARSRNMMPYQNANRSTKKQLLYSSMCPHACKLSNDLFNSNLGLSPKSVVLLDVVSEKLIRALLDKCLLTDNFMGTFAFDEFPENEQLHDVRKLVCDDEVLPYSYKEIKVQEVDSSTSLFTYDVRYTEEPWLEAQSGVSSCESALDVLAHTLVKPVMTELSFSIEHPRQIKTSSKKMVEFTKPGSRKGHGQGFNKKHARYGKSEMCSSSRSRKSESRATSPGRRQMRKRERNRSVLDAAIQRRPVVPICTSLAKKPLFASCKKKYYRKEVVTVTEHGDHQLQPVFSAIYSSLFLENIVSQLLIKIFSSLQNKYDRDSCIDLHEMNRLFVHALMEEFKKAGVGVLQRAEEKSYFSLVDSHTVSKIADSILREFGFQLAAEGDTGKDIENLAERAAEIILTEILDYQLPPAVFRRLPQSAFRNVKPGPIIQKIEHCVCFPKVKRSKPPAPAYVTILSEKYLERVISQLLTQLFPPSEDTPCNEDKREMSDVDFNELCSYIIKHVMKSISKHKIWVAKKDDRCRLHSEKEIQNMVDSVYRNMLKKSGSQFSIQKDVECRNTAFIDCMTSFIIREITNHHLQTFLSKDEDFLENPEPEALSENIVRTVLDSISESSVFSTEVFPAKFLEEIVSRVLSKIFSASIDDKKMSKGQPETELCEVVKRIASSINLQFGRASVTGVQKGEEQSLGAPLSAVMDDVVDSVYNNIAREKQMILGGDFSRKRKNIIYENVKKLIEKGISDCLLHPLFSGDLSRVSGLPRLEVSDAVKDKEFHEDESWPPFSTLLSSGFLKDLITGLLTRIFPSTPSRDTSSTWNKTAMSESDLNKLSTQLLNDVRLKLLKHEIRVIKDTHPEQYQYSEEDVQNLTDSLCSKIIQKSGSLEAVQRDVKNKSNALIDQLAGFLVGDLLQQHVEAFVSRDETSGWDRAAAGDSMGGLEIYRTAIKPLDLREAIKKQRSSPTSLLGNIISELLSKISDTFSDIPLSASGEDVGDVAMRLAKTVTKELAKAHINVQEGPDQPLGSAPPDTNVADQDSSYIDSIGSFLSKEDTEDVEDASPCQTTTIKIEEAVDHLLHSACPSNALEAKCLIQENLMEQQCDPQEKPSVSPYITLISYPVLEAIIDRLFAHIFPLASTAAATSDKGEGLYGPELQDRLAQLKMDIMAIILKQAIWTSTYGSEKETGISEKAIENMVESVYCDVLHEVLLQQPFSEDRESLNNLYVTQIACFIINEMFKHHLQFITSEYAPSYINQDARNFPDSEITVFPCIALENMLNQLLEKLFPNPENIADYTGKYDDFSETDFTEMAANLKGCVVTEILAHEVKMENVSERIPDMDQETEEDIANSVYNQLLQTYQPQGELQNTLMVQGNGTVHEIAKLLIREILNFHFHPFLSSNDPSECFKWQKERQQCSRRIYSVQFLEDVVVAFFCKFLSSPNILAYSKDTNLSEKEMRDLVIELVNGLVIELKMSEVKVMQSTGENICLPQIGAEKVIQISNSIYEKILQQFGSEFEIFKAFQTNSCLLAEKLALIILKDISDFQLLPLFTGDTSPYLFSFVEAETIVDRVETLLPEPPSSGSVFGDIFVKILHRIFPSWLPDNRATSPDPTVNEEGKRSPSISHLKEEPSSDASKSIENILQNICKTIYVKSGSPNRKQESTAEQLMETEFLSKTKQLMQFENGGDTYSASFLKDIFSGLISKLLKSTASVCMLEKQGAEAEPSLKYLIESILKEFAKSPVKVLQIPEGGQSFPDVEKAEIAKIIHASLCSILQDQRSGVPIYTDKENGHTFAERLASAIKKEILGYQIQEVQSKTFQDPASKPFEFGEMAKKVFTEVKKISTPSQIDTPCPFLVSQRFIFDVLAFLLSKILPLPTPFSTSTDTEDQCAEFDFIHMKLLSKVMAEISKNKNAEVKYLDGVQPNRVFSQTVANSIYNNLLPEFGSTSDVQKCIRTGCTILLERIVDIVIKEISGNQIQMYFTEELNRQQEAIEAEKALEDQYGASSEPSEGQSQLRTHLKGLSTLILEEIAVKLLTKMFSSLPLDEVDTSHVASMEEVARKIINSLQNLLSNGKLTVWQHDDSEDLASEDSRTVGEVVDSVYSDILKHSNSETFLYEDLTNSNEDFANRVACFMVSEISKHDFQPVSDSEKEIPSPSMIKLESEKILKKIISDIEAGQKLNNISDTQTAVVSVAFLEEIVSRFLIRILVAQYNLGIHKKKSLSKTDVNEIAGQLKTSVEKEMSKNKIKLIASDNQLVLDPGYEEAVNQVVHSVISNVLEKSGSQKELYTDMTTKQEIFPEQVASIIINEISSSNPEKPLGDNSENETYSAMELDRIVSKVLAQVNSHMELEENKSLLELSGLSECRDEPTLANLSQADEAPLKIVPYIGKKPLKIDPDIVGDHLAVLSIKTEPLEKLKKTCLSKIGLSLAELRRASASGKSLAHNLEAASVPFTNKKKERRPSLDMTGRLAVRPKEPVCRNSFQSLTKPDITKVELLKDVESKQDLIIRLVAHDIDSQDHPARRVFEDSESDEEEQQSLRGSLETKPSLWKRFSSMSAGSSIGGVWVPKDKKYESPLPEQSPSLTNHLHEAVASSPGPPVIEKGQSTPPGSLQPDVHFAESTKSDEKDASIEEALVGMHLSRDTEETAAIEITSVYQNKSFQIPDSASQTQTEEDGKVTATINPEGSAPPRQRSSVFEKVSTALSKVFSRTSASNLTQSATVQEKSPGDKDPQ
ncbi:fibrous sheath-interacting protein 2 isoform X2 [Crotalus tigris]|uniref:fibrous sheath-interacting protein 2 isoform X2 n=1 Tax=Crotalus tigris TaxID=88082 RepID=UPI00192F4C0C|nr:fibrous sheath-interacting protein 2 isoform X2 [Crotalus tigris]